VGALPCESQRRRGPGEGGSRWQRGYAIKCDEEGWWCNAIKCASGSFTCNLKSEDELEGGARHDAIL
jgi:hypothetical protein